jgi:L-ascorbate metabolism protein UlaG (beta-lactamase superfamily)
MRVMRSSLLRATLASLVGVLTTGAADPAAADTLTLRWLGVAGFTIDDGETVIAEDPYLSRPGVIGLLFERYRPDPAVLEPLLGEDGAAPELARARLFLVGHSHFDHLGDVPWLARRTGGRIVGTRTTSLISQGYGVAPDHTLVAAPGEETSEGAFDVRAVKSEHARVLLGRVPLDGVVEEVPDAPCHVFSMKMGGALGYLVTHRPSGLRLFLLSSAGLDTDALAALLPDGERIDVLLTAITGREPDYAARLVEHLRPREVVPHHFDSFLIPLDDADAGAPSDADDLDAFEAEVREAAASRGLDVSIRRPRLFERWSVGTP